MHWRPLFTTLGLWLLAVCVCDGDRDVTGTVAGMKLHQDAALVVGVGGLDGITDVTGLRHALARHFEDHVAFLDAAGRRGTVRIDVGHDDASLAGARD